MALDSTGSHIPTKIPCFICAKTQLEYDSYTPQYGHAGENLNVGSCMGPHDRKIKNLDGARLFSLKPGDPCRVFLNPSRPRTILYPEEIRLTISGEPYHYRGFQEPEFGAEVGQVVFVCSACVQHQGEDLEQRVGEITDLALHNRYAIILDECFIGRKHKIPRAERWQRERRLKDFIEELERLEQNSTIRHVLRKLRRAQREIFTKKQSSNAA